MRFHTRLRRVLTLVDLLAPLRHGMSVEELSNDLQSKIGIRICRRSVHRDIALLLDLGIAERISRGRFRLNRLSDSLQQAAYLMEPSQECSPHTWDYDHEEEENDEGDSLWDVYVVDLSDNQTHCVRRMVEKDLAVEAQATWNVKQNNAVVVIWPSWAKFNPFAL